MYYAYVIRVNKKQLISISTVFLLLLLLALPLITVSNRALADTGHTACRDAYGRTDTDNNNMVLVGLSDFEQEGGLGQFNDNIVCGGSLTDSSIIALVTWDTGSGNVAISRGFVYTGERDYEGTDVEVFFFEYSNPEGEPWTASVQKDGSGGLIGGWNTPNNSDVGTVDDPQNLIELLERDNPENRVDPIDEGFEGEEQTTCEDAGGGFAWAFCGALRVFSWALDYVDQSLEGWLRMSRERFDSTELRDAWVVIRNIAYLLLVPAMLVMIIGTALGFEFVSAYTVKSALPRMVAATIFIALSYDLSVFFVDVVQTIGDGIHNILLFPFRDILDWVTLERGTTLSEIAVRPSDGLGGAAAGTALSAGILALAGVAAASVAGGGIIATVAGFIGLALLALLAVFVLLLARQTLIVALILFSPIAILAWIFPGRTRIFSLWNKTFWLMMWFYPVIMVTTAVGKIMAALVISGV